MEVLQTIPILRIFDVAKARVLSGLSGLPAASEPSLELAPWNARLVQLTDPFGNRLRFNEDLK